MAQAVKHVSLPQLQRDNLNTLIAEFCSSTGQKQKKSTIAEFTNQFVQYAEECGNNKQYIGAWISCFLELLIPRAARLRHEPDMEHPNLISFLLKLPLDEKSDEYKAVASAMKPKDVEPLTAKDYLLQLQICFLLIELGYSKADMYLKKLSCLTDGDYAPSQYSLIIRMLEAKVQAISADVRDEQLIWLDLILNAWVHLDKRDTVYFLSQWINSLKWIKPGPVRKDLLNLLLEASQQSDNQNQAIILYDLFNLSDKAISTGEKLNYLGKIFSLPKELFRVDQLQNMYYFSGNMKSSIESSFMESVTDFQQSNYYIYRYWCWINSINHFFQNRFPAEEYLGVQSRIEQKTMELINLINIQSNAYVETLQSNFTKIEELYHQVEELSLRDSLTGLYNRRFLYNNINELLQLAVRQQSPLSFVLIDIDDFKPVNDTYGHLAGDFILRDMSNHLKGFFRKSDFVIRYGGEEFLIVMFNSDQLQAEQTLENLRTSINSRVLRYMNTYLHITVSVGIASCKFSSSFNSVNLEKLIAEADAAMYESKTHGKNKITSRVISS